MIEDIKKIEISNNVNLHLIKSNKFKTNLSSIFLKRPISLNEATKNMLLVRVLEKANSYHPTPRDLSKKLEELYGGIIAFDVLKRGEKQILALKTNFLNENYINESNFFEKTFEILKDMLFNPLLIEHSDGRISFKKEFFEKEKKELRNNLISIKMDKAGYSVDRCIEIMCKDEPYGVLNYGSIEELEKIDEFNLYEHYKNIINTSMIDIVIIGNIDFIRAENIIKSGVNFNIKNPVNIPSEKVKYSVIDVNRVTEKFDVKQARIVIGYRFNIDKKHKLYNAMTLFAAILGFGSSSKLFLNIREKENLCYSIGAKLEKTKSIMIISAGIEPKNLEKTEMLIDKNIKDMQEGKFSEDDINIAKKFLESSVDSVSDFPNGFINFYYSQSLLEKEFDIEKIKNRYKNITKEEIVEAGKLIFKDTVYYIDKV